MQIRKDPNVMIINPTQMTDDEEIILNYVLAFQVLKGIYFYNKDCLLPIPIGQIDYETDIDVGYFRDIQLTHPIVRRSRKNEPDQYRYEVYGQMIGGGSFGRVYKSIGTLVPLQCNRMLLKNSNPRVIKEMISNQNESHIEMATQEYEMTRRDEELGVKRPVFFSTTNIFLNETHSFMVMKFIPGEELRNVINKDQINKKYENHIDTDTRIKMSISMGIALERMHRNNIINGDVKSSNVMIDMTSPIKKVKIIDFGGSRDKDAKINMDPIYTPIYAAPEVQERCQVTQESDVYSGAWLFNGIWRGDNHPVQALEDKFKDKMQNTKKPINFKKIEKKKKEIRKKVVSVSHNCKFKNLFTGINDLDKSHRHRIKCLLKKKTDINPANRQYFSEFIEVFEDISFERIIKKLLFVAKSDVSKYKAQEQHINELRTAHILGIQLRNLLDKFVTCDFTNITSDDLIKIKLLLLDQKSGIPALSDNQDVISLFTERLRILALLGLTCKQAIIDKLSDIIDTYILNMKMLLKIQDQIEELRSQIKENINPLEQAGITLNPNVIYSDLSKCDHQIEMLKNEKHQLTIDKIASINVKLKKHIDKLHINLDLIKTQLGVKLSELETKQNEQKEAEERLSNTSYLGYYFQSTKNYVSQLGFFTQVMQESEAKQSKHEVRLTLKNYQ